MAMSERIRFLVKRHPKSRQEIAADLFMSADCLGNYITGRRCPDAAMVRKMAIYFKVSADFILCLSPSSRQPTPMPTPSQESNLLSLFRSMTPQQRDFYIQSGYGITQYDTLQQLNPACAQEPPDIL